MDYSQPGSSVHGISQERILKWVAIFFSRGSSNPGIKPMSPALQVDTLPLSYQGSPLKYPVVFVQLLSLVLRFATPWTAARQSSLPFTISLSLLKLISIESVMPLNHLILCHPLLLLPSIFPSIRIFSNESALCFRSPKHWSFSFSTSPSNEYSGLISFRLTSLIFLLSKGFSRIFSSTTVWKHQFLGAQSSL